MAIMAAPLASFFCLDDFLVKISYFWVDVAINEMVSLSIGFAPARRRIDQRFSKLDCSSNILNRFIEAYPEAG
jgi:hypothetical protein